MVANTRTEALAEARTFAEKSGAFAAGMCLREIRTLYNVPAHDFTPGDGRSPDAAEAWKFASHKHPETDLSKIPPGVPVFWTGGSAGHGHIAMKAGPVGTRDVWSTDFLRTGHLDRVDGRRIGRDKWTSLRLVGWTEDLNGVRVYTPSATPAPAPAPAPKPAPKPAPHPSMALPVDLVDLSHFNDVTPAKLAAAVKGGVKGFYHKATEGTTWHDSKYATNRSLVAAVKVPFGAYHFARPGSSSGVVQARHFLSVAKPKRGGDFRVMLDLEDRGGKTRAQLTTWVGDFVREVERETGVKGHLIYTQFDLDNHFGWDLWVARYHPANLAPRVPAPWKSWKVRQFSNGVVGVPNKAPGLGAVDLNNVVGSVAALKMPAATTPKPASKPTPAPAARTLRVVTWNLERDRNPGIVRAEVDALAAETKADVLIFSEANDYTAVLRQVPGYTTYQFHDEQVREKDGTAILVRNGLKVTNPHVVKVTSAGWKTVRGGTTPPKWAVHVTVEGVEFEALSTPPSQQPTPKRRLMPARARAYDERMRNIKPSAHYVIAGDTNVTPDAAAMPSFPKRRFKALGLRLVAPKSGTHGSRTIDYLGAKGVRVGAASVVPGKRGSDHRPVQFTITKETA